MRGMTKVIQLGDQEITVRELAVWDRAAVLGFIREHVALMSREGVRYAVERMPKNVQASIYDAHKACSS